MKYILIVVWLSPPSISTFFQPCFSSCKIEILCSSNNNSLLEEVIEVTWPPGDLRAGPGQTEAPYLLSYPEKVWSAYRGSQFQGGSLDMVTHCWDHLGGTRDWTLLGPLLVHTFKILVSGMEVCWSWKLPKMTPVIKFPLGIKPAT